MNEPLERLQALYAELNEQDRLSLLAFAEFLASRRGAAPVPAVRAPVEVPRPEKIARPAGESVVAALKRLAKTYPMLDKSEMLGATSDMVATHIMQGTDPVQVIDQLEEIFAEHYRQLRERSGGVTP